MLMGVEVLADDHGGQGVFLTDDFDFFKGDSALEVMRLSRRYDLKTLLGVDNTQFKKIVNQSLGELAQLSETCMLVYFILVVHLLGLEDTGAGFPTHLTEYISSTLLTTQVPNASNCMDALLEGYGHVVLFHELKRNLDTLHEAAVKHIPFQQNYSVALLHQLYSAVVSRVLEIPQLEPGRTDGDREDDDSFIVSPTLVPTLDFVNHGDETRCNAYYDIDRSNGDIVLNLERSKVDASSLRREVLISYTDIEDSLVVITKYGFDPADDASSNAIKIFSCPFDKTLLNSIDCKGISVRNFYRWFCVLPTLQFVRAADGAWGINNSIKEFARLLLPFVCDAQTQETIWQHSEGEDAENRFMAYFKENCDPSEYETISYPMVIKQYKWYESSENDFMPLPPCVWSIKSKFTKGRAIPVMEQEDYVMDLLQNDSLLYEATLKNFANYLKAYIYERLTKLQKVKLQDNTALALLISREEASLKNTLTQLGQEQSIYLDSNDPKYQNIPVIPTRNIEEPLNLLE